MQSLFKVISLTTLVAACSACSGGDTPSHGHSDHADGHDSAHHDKEATHVNDADHDTHSGDTKVTETRSADSHAHGDASLAMVLENSLMTIEFDTPLYNILGFEHAAETAAQKAAVTKAETVLSNGGALFAFNGEAGCVIMDAAKSVDMGLEDHDDDHDEDEDHHDHDEDHHDEDDDEHEGDGHDDETHKDLIVQYEFQCANPKALQSVTVNLFESFNNLTELELVYLGPNTQKQAELSASNTRMNLTR